MKVIKEFLKPNWLKVGIFVIVLGSTLLAVFSHDFSAPCPDCYPYPYGIPFPFFRPSGIGGFAGEPYPMFINPITLLINFLIIYFLICFIYFIIVKIKRLITKSKSL